MPQFIQNIPNNSENRKVLKHDSLYCCLSNFYNSYYIYCIFSIICILYIDHWQKSKLTKWQLSRLTFDFTVFGEYGATMASPSFGQGWVDRAGRCRHTREHTQTHRQTDKHTNRQTDREPPRFAIFGIFGKDRKTKFDAFWNF